MARKRLTYEEFESLMTERFPLAPGDDELLASHQALWQSASFLNYLSPRPMAENVGSMIPGYPLKAKTKLNFRKSRISSDGSSGSLTIPGSCAAAKPITSLDFPSADKITPAHLPNDGRAWKPPRMSASVFTSTSPPSISPTIQSRQSTQPSVSTRVDEQEFLELADYYYITPRPHPPTHPCYTLGSAPSTFRARSGTSSIRPNVHAGMDIYRDPEADNGGSLRTLPLSSSRYLWDNDKSDSVVCLPSHCDWDHDDGHAFKFLPLHPPFPSPPTTSSPQTSTSSSERRLAHPISASSLVPASCFGKLSRWLWKKQNLHLGLGTSTSTSPSTTPKQEEGKFAAIKHSTRSIMRVVADDGSNVGTRHQISSPSDSANEYIFYNLDYDYDLAVKVLVYDL